MEKKKEVVLTQSSTEKPLSFTALVGEAAEKQKDKNEFEKGEAKKLPPVEVKPDKKKKLSDSEIRERRRISDARYRERKRQDEEKVKEPELKPFSIIDKDVVKVFAGVVPFGILASLLKNNKYLCNDEEKNILAVQWDNLLRSRAPEIFSQYGPECSLVVTISMLLISKSDVFSPGPEKTQDKTDKGVIKGYG